jgi:hypothetical protein
MKYQIASATSLEELVKEINSALAKGWKPIGGVAVVVDADGTTRFLQAVVNG